MGTRRRRLPANAAFLNIPYDSKYERLYLVPEGEMDPGDLGGCS